MNYSLVYYFLQATVGCFSATARILDDVDVQCKILPVMKSYLKHSIILVDREELVLNTLKDPLPKIIYDTVVKCSIVETLVDILSERKKARTIANTGHIPLPSITQSMHQNNALRNVIYKYIFIYVFIICMGVHMFLFVQDTFWKYYPLILLYTV